MPSRRDELILGLEPDPQAWQDRLDEHARFKEMSMNAAEARARFEPEYTLEEILQHVEMNCERGKHICGYHSRRMPDAVLTELESLGFRCVLDPASQEFTIRWDE